jgi:ABC-2 type transport system permease protein
MFHVVKSLAWREFTRFIRQPNRVVGTVAQPLLFWVFLGAGFTGSFRMPGASQVTYLEYFYPGVMLMMLLFASIFSSITIIEDRDAGFLQGVLVAPVSRLAIVLGKVAGGSSIALAQVAVLMLAIPFLGLQLSLGSFLLLVAALVTTAIGFASLGFLLAWGMKSTSAFHAVMMVFLMPLWMLSGALFPIDNAPLWLHALMTINPVSHALVLLRAPFYHDPAALFAQGSYLLGWTVALAWAGLCLGLSMRRVDKREKGVAAIA